MSKRTGLGLDTGEWRRTAQVCAQFPEYLIGREPKFLTSLMKPGRRFLSQKQEIWLRDIAARVSLGIDGHWRAERFREGVSATCNPT